MFSAVFYLELNATHGKKVTCFPVVASDESRTTSVVDLGRDREIETLYLKGRVKKIKLLVDAETVLHFAYLIYVRAIIRH